MTRKKSPLPWRSVRNYSSCGSGDRSWSSPIFALCGDAAADVSLRLVFFEDLFDLKIQGSVVKGQALLNILMYRALADSEFLCGFAHGGAFFDDVGGQFTGALFNVSFQDPTRSLSRYTGVYA